MAKVVVMYHPLIRHKIGYIRRKDTGTKDFRQTISEIAMLICYEATRGLKLDDVEIETPICKTTAKELKGKKMLPSQPIFDNRFLYGDYRIIGNAPVEMPEIIPLESFGRSLDANDPFWYVQYGLTYREKRRPPLLISKEYKNESIGFGLRVNVKLINDCIAADSNSPYWDLDYYYIREDLRNPTNAKMRRRIFRHFGIRDK